MSPPYVNSSQITQGPVYRRDKQCNQGFQLCPESRGGDCCPNDRSCGESSCYATTAALMSVCSKNGMLACGMDLGGGCCPSGYSCLGLGCAPTSGTFTGMCPSGAYLCPEEVAGFGACCRSGLACGSGFCYATSYPTQTLVLTSVFRDGSQDLITTTATITTAYQPLSVPAMATTAGPTRVVIMETAIPKIAAVDTTPRTGISKGTMNGIIAGAVVALVLILLGAWWIIRRLNYLARIGESAAYVAPGPGHRHNLSGDSGHSGLSNVGSEMTCARIHRSPVGALQSDMPGDPLLIASGSTTPQLPWHSLSQGTPIDTDIYGYGRSPPPITAPYDWNQDYSHASNNEGPYFSHLHHESMNSGGGMGTYSLAHNGVVSEASRESYLRDQNLRFGHDSNRLSLTSTHGRQWSDASDVSNNSSNPPYELDGNRMSAGNLDTDVGFSPGSGFACRPSAERRSSNWSLMNTGGHRKRSGSGLALHTFAFGSSTPLGGGGRLEGVAEAETDALHSTGLLGKPSTKEGRPHAATRGSDGSTAAGGQHSRSGSEGMIPQMMYANQVESHSLPTAKDCSSVTRAVPQFTAQSLSPHTIVHPPLERPSTDIIVPTTTGFRNEPSERGQSTRGTNGSNARKKEVLIRTREVNPEDL